MEQSKTIQPVFNKPNSNGAIESEAPNKEPIKDASLGDTWTITVKGHSLVIKEPNRATIGIVLSLIAPTDGKPDYIKAGEIILNSCFVSGDKSILEVDKLLVAAALKALEVVDVAEAEIKKN